MDMTQLSAGQMVSGGDIDATANRERTRQRRLRKPLVIFSAVFAFLLYRLIDDNPIRPGIPAWLTGRPVTPRSASTTSSAPSRPNARRSTASTCS